MKTVYLVGPINTETPEQYNELRKKASEAGGAYCPRTTLRNKTLTAPSFIFVDAEAAKKFEEVFNAICD